MSYLAVGANFMQDKMNEALAPYAEPKSGLAKLWDRAKGAASKAYEELTDDQRALLQKRTEQSGGGTYVAPKWQVHPTTGISPTHILIGGAALVGLFLVLKKK